MPDRNSFDAFDAFDAAPSPEVVTIPPVRALAIDGGGAPGGPAHMAALTRRFAAAPGPGRVPGLGRGQPCALPPLEGLWWVEDERPPFEAPREAWHWRWRQLLLQIPGGIPTAGLDGDDGDDGEGRIGVIELREGLAVQVLTVRAYADEPTTLVALDALMGQERLAPNGRHHEIYRTLLTDDPAAGRAILQQPVRRAAPRERLATTAQAFEIDADEGARGSRRPSPAPACPGVRDARPHMRRRGWAAPRCRRSAGTAAIRG